MEMKFRQYAGRWEILNIPEGYLCTFGFSKKKKKKISQTLYLGLLNLQYSDMILLLYQYFAFFLVVDICDSTRG